MYQKGFIKNQDDLALYIASRAKNPTKEILEQAAKLKLSSYVSNTTWN